MPQETQNNVLPNTEMVFTGNMVRERVEAAAYKIFGGVADMNDDTSFEADLGGDTLDFVEFILNYAVTEDDCDSPRWRGIFLLRSRRLWLPRLASRQPEPPTPQALIPDVPSVLRFFITSRNAKLRMLIAAFVSLSMDAPHSGQL